MMIVRYADDDYDDLAVIMMRMKINFEDRGAWGDQVSTC